ncbi:MAG: endonuclease/exonuclease/phosphatase family protein, partial [Pseudomonadota bacterium]
HGGGTMIFAADYLNTKKSSRLSKKDHEAVWIEVKIKKAKPIFVCSIYRPPSSRDIEHVERCCSYLSDCVDNLPNNSEIFIMGDFNVDMSKKNTLTSLINDLCKSKVLTQHVTSPTRVTNTSSTMIDLVLSNSLNAKDCKVVDLGLSDHSLLHIRRDKLTICRPQKSVTSRSYKNFNEELFLADLKSMDWTNVTNTHCLDDAAEAFNMNVLVTLDRHAPITTKRVCHTNPPWVNNDLLQEIKEKRYLKKVASRSNLIQDWAVFRRKRNSVNALKRHLKRDYYQSTLNENRQNSQKLWKTLNNIIPGSKQCNTLPQSILKNNIEISDKKEIAKTFNEFFISIGSNLASAFNFTGTSHINPPINQNSFTFSHVTTSSVKKLISSLDNNKATGLYRTILPIFSISLYLLVMFLSVGRKNV